MTDDNAPWFSPKHRPVGIPRQSFAGEEVWRLHDHTGQIQTCELRDQSSVGAGWDVLISVNGEPSFSRRCADKAEARFVAEAIQQDNVRGGWTRDIERTGYRNHQLRTVIEKVHNGEQFRSLLTGQITWQRLSTVVHDHVEPSVLETGGLVERLRRRLAAFRWRFS